MGLADRDYMRERRRPGDRSVFAPPEPTFRSTLQYIWWFVCVAYISVKVLHWWAEKHQPPQAQVPAPVALEKPATQQMAKRYPQLTGNWDPNRSIPVQTPPAAPPLNARTITKCVTNGRVTFSDSACEAGASTSQIATSGNRNVVDSTPVIVARTPPPEPVRQVVANDVSPSAASSTGPDPAAARIAECAFHDQAIQSIDARARQPLSAYEQDWLSGKRKEHRDAQFRLRC